MINKIEELKRKSATHPIALKEDTDSLSEKLLSIQNGIGYAVIIGPKQESFARIMTPDYVENLYRRVSSVSRIISKTAEPLYDSVVTAITNGLIPTLEDGDNNEVLSYNVSYVAGLMSLSDLDKSFYNQKIYFASEAQDSAFESAVTHSDYNHVSHLKIIDLYQAETVSTLKNPTAVIIDYQSDVTDLLGVISNGKPEVLIFKMCSHSKERIECLLDHVYSLDEKPLLCCEPDMEENLTEINDTLRDFVFSCRERGLKPSVFKLCADEVVDFESDKTEILAKNIGDMLACEVEVQEKYRKEVATASL